MVLAGGVLEFKKLTYGWDNFIEMKFFEVGWAKKGGRAANKPASGAVATRSQKCSSGLKHEEV